MAQKIKPATDLPPALRELRHGIRVEPDAGGYTVKIDPWSLPEPANTYACTAVGGDARAGFARLVFGQQRPLGGSNLLSAVCLYIPLRCIPAMLEVVPQRPPSPQEEPVARIVAADLSSLDAAANLTSAYADIARAALKPEVAVFDFFCLAVTPPAAFKYKGTRIDALPVLRFFMSPTLFAESIRVLRELEPKPE